MKIQFPLRIIAAAMLLHMANASFAAPLPSVSSAASVSNVQFRTVDLTPDDGQTGGITFTGANASLSAKVGTALSNTRPYQALSAATVAVANNFHSASATQSGAPGEVALHTEAHGYDWAIAESTQRVDFILQGHTALTLTGHVAGFAHQDDGLEYPWVTSSVYATLQIDVWNTLGSVSKYVSAFRSQPDRSYSEDFVVSYANNTDSAISMYWYTSIYANGSNGINAPVPEPETYAMLAAGLALIGLATRRRNRQRLG